MLQVRAEAIPYAPQKRIQLRITAEEGKHTAQRLPPPGLPFSFLSKYINLQTSVDPYSERLFLTKIQKASERYKSTVNIILNAATTQHRYKFTIYISGSFITVIYTGRYLERSDSGIYLVPLKNIVFRSLFFFFFCFQKFVLKASLLYLWDFTEFSATTLRTTLDWSPNQLPTVGRYR